VEIKNCKKCDIAYTRKNIVNGYGKPTSDIMIIGEAPGYAEDIHGTPFVGTSGRYLREILFDAGFIADNFYITNVIKCKPPNNRKPTKREITNCSVNLQNELNTIQPRFILLLGRTAYETIFGKSPLKMSEIVKKVYITKNNTYIYCTYHPSYIIRNLPAMDNFYIRTFHKLYDMYVTYINPYYKLLKSSKHG